MAAFVRFKVKGNCTASWKKGWSLAYGIQTEVAMYLDAGSSSGMNVFASAWGSEASPSADAHVSRHVTAMTES